MWMTALLVGLVTATGVVGFAVACCCAAGKADALHEETRRRQALCQRELL